MGSINFISKVLTNTSYHYDELLPFLTVTSVMMFIFDNRITFADKFHLLSIDQYGILKSIQLDDIKRMSNSIYTLAHEKDYDSISKLNPLYNSPRDYYSLSNSIDFYSNYYNGLFYPFDSDLIALKKNENVAIILLPNNFDICNVIFDTEFLLSFPNAEHVSQHLNTVILKGLQNHPLFIFDKKDNTYDVCVCTHNIPKKMNSTEFTFLGIDTKQMKSRYMLNIVYNIPSYFFKSIIPVQHDAEIRDHLIEIEKCYYNIKKVRITPRELYLHDNMLVKNNGKFSLFVNNNIPKNILSIYDQINNNINFHPHKVCTNDTIIKIHKDWIIK